MEILKKIEKKYGMTTIHEKENFLEEVKVAKGIVNDFYVNVEDEDDRFIVKVNIDKNADRDGIMEFLKGLSKKISGITEVSCEKCYAQIIANNKVSEKQVSEIIDETVNYLSENNVKSMCAFCGENDTEIALTAVIKSEPEVFHICEKCHGERAKELREKKEEKDNQSENMFLGIIGALVGTIPGILLWVVLSRIRIFAVISSPIIVVGAMYGYSWAGKKVGKLGQIFSALIGLGGMVLAHFIDTAFQLKKEVSENGVKIGIVDAIKQLSELLQIDPNVKKYFYQDVYFWIGMIIAVFMVLVTSRMIARESKGIYRIERF